LVAHKTTDYRSKMPVNHHGPIASPTVHIFRECQ